MKSKVFLATLIILLVVIFTYTVRVSQNNYTGEVVLSDKPQDTQIGESNSISNLSQENGGISISTLSQHDSLDDCWIAYDGKVYDITSFLPRHEGGQGAILPYCGSADEFERAFVAQHGTSKVKLLIQVGTFIGDFDVIGDLNG